MVQRRAARYVLNRYHNRSSVSDMIQQLDWPPLEHRRENARLSMMYKMTHGLVNVQNKDKIVANQRQSRNNNSMSYQIPTSRTDVRKKSFYPRTIRDWNTLYLPALCLLRVLGPSRLYYRKQITLSVFKYHCIYVKHKF